MVYCEVTVSAHGDRSRFHTRSFELRRRRTGCRLSLQGVLHHPEGVDFIPANIQLSGMEVSLVNAMSRESILRQYLETMKEQYSYILIDCQPSLGYGSPVATSKHRRWLEVPTEPTGETAHRQRFGCGGPHYHSRSGRIPTGKRFGAAAFDHWKGKASTQSQIAG